MAGGRRNPGGRTTPSTKNQSNNSNNLIGTSNNTGLHNGGNHPEEKKNHTDHLSNGRILAPKHVPIPSIPVNSQLLFESITLLALLIATCMQLLNLYKTVWWLPQSYNEYSMSFYLIDPYLLLFIVVLITRQFVYALICKSIDSIIPIRWVATTQSIVRILMLLIIMCVLFWSLYYLYERHSMLRVFYLCYPGVSIYLLIFGANIGPFFDVSTPPMYIKEDRKTKYLLDKPLHNCSLSATAIRAEVASLRADFNRRLKRALFASFGSAYLCCIAPLIFVPQHLHFDISWVVQYIILVWLGRFGAHFAQAYPVRYCDVLHRAALHLGKWSKIDIKNSQLAIQMWNESILWPQASVVKHNKDYYRSEGLCTAAEPGNSNHKRFYALFGNPTILQFTLLSLELSLVAVQLVILIHTTEWYKILSMSLLIVTNYYTLFKLTRDYLVCWRVYRAEQIVQEKAQIAVSNSKD